MADVVSLFLYYVEEQLVQGHTDRRARTQSTPPPSPLLAPTWGPTASKEAKPCVVFIPYAEATPSRSHLREGCRIVQVGLGNETHVPWEALPGEDITVTLSQSPLDPGVPLMDRQVIRRILRDSLQVGRP